MWRHGHEWRNGRGATDMGGAMGVAPRTRVAQRVWRVNPNLTITPEPDTRGAQCPRCVVTEVWRTVPEVCCDRGVS